ncbi:glycerophosphodiester phosphodiesterase [candidate division KSB3 bacterium]|uniref:glycerophosphodiester phosphodiesterase n=1 Tax=candidate division KSB3 bacterium TaxID=2044937 RepID=A0A2G6KF65_9BACT|nr:MAG: glycerophosphodiester phosphodiesterase [candidate division KSB3 bacterium]
MGTALREKIVIAHRAASGYLPEHTLEAVALAYGMGADFIEQDLVLTRDGIPVVLHDIYLDTTTNVRRKFPDRSRADGRWYAIDFTLEEIKALDVHERIHTSDEIAVFPNRFPVGHSHFTIPTLAEEIELIQGLNKSMGRSVGIYPELKLPAFHTQEGYDIGKTTLDILTSYGYASQDANVYIQCFDAQYLKRLRFELNTPLPCIQLIGDGESYDWLVTAEGLDDVAMYADGIGPSINRLVRYKRKRLIMIMEPVKEAHDHKLVVHPYTFRKDSLPPYANSLDELFRMFYFIMGVDGVFTDFPDTAVKLLRAAGY